MIGIEESRKIVDIVADTLNVGGEIFRDGNVDWSDTDQILPLGSALLPLKDIKYADLVKEFGDYSPEEQTNLIAAFNERFDIPQDDIELYVEQLIRILNLQVKVVREGLRLWEQLKGHKKA